MYLPTEPVAFGSVLTRLLKLSIVPWRDQIMTYSYYGNILNMVLEARGLLAGIFLCHSE